MIIQALSKPRSQNKKREELLIEPNRDIIVVKTEYEETENAQGERVLKRKTSKVNVSKKVNETAKVVREKSAAERLAEMEKFFKENN